MKLYYIQSPLEAIKRGTLNAGWHAPSTNLEISADYYITPEKQQHFATIQKLTAGDYILVGDSSSNQPTALALASVKENLTGNHCEVEFFKNEQDSPLFIPITSLPKTVTELITSSSLCSPSTIDRLPSDLVLLYEDHDTTKELEDTVTALDSDDLEDHTHMNPPHDIEPEVVGASVELTHSDSTPTTQSPPSSQTSQDVQKDFQVLQTLANALGLHVEPEGLETKSNLFAIMGLDSDLKIHLHMLSWLCDQKGSHGLGSDFIKAWLTSPNTPMHLSTVSGGASVVATSAEHTQVDSITLSDNTTGEKITLSVDASLCSSLSHAIEQVTTNSAISDAEAQFLLSNYNKFLSTKNVTPQQVNKMAEAIYNEHTEAFDSLFLHVHNKASR